MLKSSRYEFFVIEWKVLLLELWTECSIWLKRIPSSYSGSGVLPVLIPPFRVPSPEFRVPCSMFRGYACVRPLVPCPSSVLIRTRPPLVSHCCIVYCCHFRPLFLSLYCWKLGDKSTTSIRMKHFKSRSIQVGCYTLYLISFQRRLQRIYWHSYPTNIPEFIAGFILVLSIIKSFVLSSVFITNIIKFGTEHDAHFYKIDIWKYVCTKNHEILA